MRDPYEILGIPADATLAQAKAAYRRLAELFHPDRLQGLRSEVQAEGARRLREANEAMRSINARFGRPLTAPGHSRGHGDRGPSATRHDATEHDSGERDTSRPAGSQHAGRRRGRARQWRVNGGIPTPPRSTDPGRNVSKPSDAATDAEARICDVELRGVDGPKFHVRWTGRHAAATLSALRHSHRINGAIRQIEWGSYEGVFDGAAIRRLLASVLSDDEWRTDRAEIVHLPAELKGRLLPARPGAVPETFIELGSVINLLEDGRWYSVLADVY